VTVKRRTGLAAALSVLALATFAAPAQPAHVRPQGASPMRLALVPAFGQCTAANRSHGEPLVFPSCTPPGRASSFLTVGSEVNGAAPNSTGFVHLKAIPGIPGPPDDSDILVRARLTDVRCDTGTTACGEANEIAGPDYTGELQVALVIRITDHYNSTPPLGGFFEAATVIDVAFPVDAPCANTAPTEGALCSVDTSFNAVLPAVAENMSARRAVIELAQLQVLDGGPDGETATEDNTVFAVPGVFVP
jgi:hypothetical protein